MKNNSWRITYCLVHVVLVLFSASCDILRLSPFEILQWGPGEGRYIDPDTVSVFLEFSLEPDKASVEKNFSLLEDGNKVRGIIQWQNLKMLFFPLVPLEYCRDYTLELSSDAHDTKGLSLDRTFEGRFSTRPDDTRPQLLDFFPEMYSITEESRAEIRLLFSREIPINSLYDNVSFSPAMNGIWRYENSQAVFSPLDPWIYGKRYEIRISGSLQADNGKTMSRDFLSYFYTGPDSEKPCLLGAWRLSDDGNKEKLTEENHTLGIYSLACGIVDIWVYGKVQSIHPDIYSHFSYVHDSDNYSV